MHLKKIFAVVAVLAVTVLTLAACGDSPAAENVQTGGGQQETNIYDGLELYENEVGIALDFKLLYLPACIVQSLRL